MEGKEKEIEKYENGRIIATILQDNPYYLPLIQEKQIKKDIKVESTVQAIKNAIDKLTTERGNLEGFLDAVDGENKNKLTKEDQSKMVEVYNDWEKTDARIKRLKRLLGCFSDKVSNYYKFMTLQWLVQEKISFEDKNKKKDEYATLERDALIVALSLFLKPEYVISQTQEKNNNDKLLLCFLKDYYKDIASDFNTGSRIVIQNVAPNGITLSNNECKKDYILNKHGILFPAGKKSQTNVMAGNVGQVKAVASGYEPTKKENYDKNDIKALLQKDSFNRELENLKLKRLVDEKIMQYTAPERMFMSFLPFLWAYQLQMQNKWNNGMNGMPQVSPMFPKMMPNMMSPGYFPKMPQPFTMNDMMKNMQNILQNSKAINNTQPSQLQADTNTVQR